MMRSTSVSIVLMTALLAFLLLKDLRAAYRQPPAATRECPATAPPLPPSPPAAEPAAKKEKDEAKPAPKLALKFRDDQSFACDGFDSCPFLSQLGEDQEFLRYLISAHQQSKNSQQLPADLKEILPTGPQQVVLEIGGLDGVTYSNSYFYEKVLGWRAVLIEPSYQQFSRIAGNRPQAIGLNAAICDQVSEIDFADSAVGAVNGIPSFFNKDFKQRWHSGSPVTKVQCLPLTMIMKLVGIRDVFLFFLDVEGAELAVLNGVDFSHLNIKYMVIEMDGGNPEKDKGVHELLKKNGYEFVMKIGQKYNDLFRKKE